ncbi:MAG: hypothetical protein HYS23_11475 [Geobacter sp.]|nr:hypothetical protein [Geobacter sp.]
MSTAIDRHGRVICSLLVLLLLSGCGAIYSDTIYPYSRKFDKTPVGTKRCEINTHHIREPISGYGISAAWTSEYIRKEAEKAGITNIYYTDKRTLSILLGIYERESLYIYGD